MTAFEIANSVDECADESLQEPIALETPRKRDYDEIAEDATRSTSCMHVSTTTIQHCWFNNVGRCCFRLNRPLHCIELNCIQ